MDEALANVVLAEDFFNILKTDLIGYPCTEEIRDEIFITIGEAENHSRVLMICRTTVMLCMIDQLQVIL